MLLLCMMPLNISAVIVCRPLELQNLNEKLIAWNELGRMHPIKFLIERFLHHAESRGAELRSPSLLHVLL